MYLFAKFSDSSFKLFDFLRCFSEFLLKMPGLSPCLFSSLTCNKVITEDLVTLARYSAVRALGLSLGLEFGHEDVDLYASVFLFVNEA